MGTKTSSGATILDKCLRLSVADLKRAGLFASGVTASTCLRWGDASITVSVDNVENTVTLDYRFNGIRICYDVRIVERRSNLGCGAVRFFMCPTSHALCRKLYLVNGRFVSRRAAGRAMYLNQTKSRIWRNVADGWGSEDFIPYRRYGKVVYKGRLTPYGKRIQRYIEMEERSLCALMECLNIPF